MFSRHILTWSQTRSFQLLNHTHNANSVRPTTFQPLTIRVSSNYTHTHTHAHPHTATSNKIASVLINTVWLHTHKNCNQYIIGQRRITKKTIVQQTNIHYLRPEMLLKAFKLNVCLRLTYAAHKIKRRITHH